MVVVLVVAVVAIVVVAAVVVVVVVACSSSVTAEAVEVGGLGAVCVAERRASVGIGKRHMRRDGLHIAVPSGRGPFYRQRKGLRFATRKGLEEDTPITTLLLPPPFVPLSQPMFRRADWHVR